LTTIYVVLAIIPDKVYTAGIFASTGITISVGRKIQAVALAAVLILMTMIGRGHYVVHGIPFEWVYLEIRAKACVADVLTEDLVELEIENHLIQTQADADTAAAFVLFREQAKANERAVTMIHDLRLEPDDIFQTADDRRYMIASIQRVLQRDIGMVVAQLQCFEVTPGVYP
jgi:hypothetical protein